MSFLHPKNKGPQANAPTMASGMRVQTSVFGKALPIIYGTNRVPSNLIWYGAFLALPVSSGGGGKGGGGGGKGGQATSYNYYASMAFAICEGPITTIGRVWQNKNIGTLGTWGLSAFSGTYPQSPWSYLTTNFPGQDLNYAGVAYVAVPNYNLGSSPETPQHNFEVYGRVIYDYAGGIFDAEPSAVITDYLTNANYGVPGFTAGMIGDLTAFMQYCVANGIFVSPVIDTHTEARQFLTELLALANSAPVWSEGTLKIVPYGDATVTGNGVTFTPNLTPVYSLTDNDFIASEGSAPVTCDRRDIADVYNQLTLECVDRSNEYVVTPVEAKDQGYIDTYGYNPTPSVVRAHEICSVAVGRLVVQILLQRQIYQGRNVYTFTLPVNFCLIEPMDLLEITDANLGLAAELVRILSVEEADGDKGDITVVAEDVGIGSGSAPQYASPTPLGYAADYNADPGNVNRPIFMEAPAILTTGGLELWLGISSASPLWGGAYAYVSSDDVNYQYVGTVFGNSRMGKLSADLPAGSDPDTVNTLSVDLTESLGSLLSGTKADADLGSTLCYVDGEYISYETAVLTGANQYNLTYLVRNWYGSSNTLHLVNSNFVRLDEQVFKYAYTSDRIGTPVYVKFQSFNIFGGGLQDISTVPAYQYTIKGTSLLGAIANVTNLTTRYVAGILQISWDAIADFRPLDYEVRFGNTWDNSKVLGRVFSPEFPSQGDGTYWVAGHFKSPDGADIYSATPVDVAVAGASLTTNVLVSYDQVALGWPGTLSGGAAIVGSTLILGGSGDILSVADYLALTDVLRYGGVASSGSYQIPSSEQINVARVAPCNIIFNYQLNGVNINDNVLTVADYLNVTDLLDAASGVLVGAVPQIRIAPASGVFGAWQNFIPGVYSGQYFDARILLASSDTQVYPVVSSFVFTVDMPDLIWSVTDHTLVAAGETFVFTEPFNAGPGGTTLPNIQVTILSAQAGDVISLTGTSLTGFTLQILNGGVGVQRNVNIIAQGY